MGNLTSTTDANGQTRNFGYDANGNQTNSWYAWTPPGGGSTQYVTNRTVHDAQGRATVTVDVQGNTNRTFYNALGKVECTNDQPRLALRVTMAASRFPRATSTPLHEGLCLGHPSKNSSKKSFYIFVAGAYPDVVTRPL